MKSPRTSQIKHSPTEEQESAAPGTPALGEAVTREASPKPKNWTREFSATLLAAGVLVPDGANAAAIPLADPSFENYVVPLALGYAYANTYRPTSAWVDDLDSPPGYTQDNLDSNWLYNSAYAEGTTKRGFPRTGNQAMHGLFNYNAQETSAVFEASMTYTFSIWAQGDHNATLTSSRVWLYMFDGSIPFSEANSLTFKRFGVDTGDFINRPVGSTPAQSQAAWTQISLTHTVLPGAPEIGHPIGVGFWLGDDACVDDATLTYTVVPEPTAMALGALGVAGILVTRRRRRAQHGP